MLPTESACPNTDLLFQPEVQRRPNITSAHQARQLPGRQIHNLSVEQSIGQSQGGSSVRIAKLLFDQSSSRRLDNLLEDFRETLLIVDGISGPSQTEPGGIGLRQTGHSVQEIQIRSKPHSDRIEKAVFLTAKARQLNQSGVVPGQVRGVIIGAGVPLISLLVFPSNVFVVTSNVSREIPVD